MQPFLYRYFHVGLTTQTKNNLLLFDLINSYSCMLCSIVCTALELVNICVATSSEMTRKVTLWCNVIYKAYMRNYTSMLLRSQPSESVCLFFLNAEIRTQARILRAAANISERKRLEDGLIASSYNSSLFQAIVLFQNYSTKPLWTFSEEHLNTQLEIWLRGSPVIMVAWLLTEVTPLKSTAWTSQTVSDRLRSFKSSNLRSVGDITT